MELLPNNGKNLEIIVDGRTFQRYPVKTKLITPEDKNIAEIVHQYASPYVKQGDTF